MDTIAREEGSSRSETALMLERRGYAEFKSPRGIADAVWKAQEEFEGLLESPWLPLFRIPEKDWPKDRLDQPLEQGIIFKPGGRKEAPTPQEVSEGRFLSDKKWYYHYVRGLRETHHARQAPTERYDAFFDAMELLTAAAVSVVEGIAREMDAQGIRPASGPSFSERMQAVRDNPARAITRINRYEDGFGNLHWDRDSFTCHWRSSAKGLTLFDRTGTPVAVDETNPHTACVFFGLKYFAMRREAPGETGLHGVRASEIRTGAKKRFSIATFIHLPLMNEERAWYEANRGLFTIKRKRLQS